MTACQGSLSESTFQVPEDRSILGRMTGLLGLPTIPALLLILVLNGLIPSGRLKTGRSF